MWKCGTSFNSEENHWKLVVVTIICLQLWYQQTAVSVSFSSYSSYTATVARQADEVYDVVTSHQPIPEILGVL